QRPVVLVIDDLQWVDQDSAQVLAYAIQRLSRPGLRVLATERLADAGPPRFRSLVPSGAVEFTVGPLTEEALVTLLRQRSEGLVGRPLAVEINRVTEGNPLFALEIAAALVRQGLPPAPGVPLPVPEAVGGLLSQRLAAVPQRVRATLLTAAAAARPTLTLLQRAGRTNAVRDLAEAERCGAARLLEDGSVAFSHPLMRAVVYGSAPVPQRLRTHARLAEVVADPVQRARHLAAARPVEDEAVAAALMDAAAVARQRGAAGVATELAESAADRTPAADREAWAERKLAAATHAEAAGRYEEGRAAVDAVLAADVPSGAKTRAKLLRLRQLGQGILQAQELVDEVLAETAGEPTLAAQAHLHSANRYRTGGQYGRAAAEARRAAEQAAAVCDSTTEFLALELLLSLLRLTADAEYDDTLKHALARMAACPQADAVSWLIRLEQGRAFMSAGEPTLAHQTLSMALRTVERLGDPVKVAYVLKSLLYVEVRVGRCDNALRVAERLNRMAEDGDDEYLGAQLAARACAELAGGVPARAERLAAQGVEESERIGDSTHAFVCTYMLGKARLFNNDAEGAIEAFRSAGSIVEKMGVVDHAFFPWPVDLADSLIAVGRLAEASAVVAEARSAAVRLDRETLLAGLDRSTALLLSAEGDRDDAVRLLTQVLEVYRRLDLPFEVARTLVELGVLQRRLRRRAAAERLLTEARDIYAAAHAVPWRDRTIVELERLHGARLGRGTRSLTPTEERIVGMIVSGATNRQIATALSASVKTVEGAISRIYRKLNVRSRLELVRSRTNSAG
ncbi:MAG TPA: LuxR C-terminal-related transcriptional regulator, partial [Pilimelia sp.]|nr:LuxR C-terminal-related transcriptional regulator [Pilimelia sp.]